MLNFFQEKVDPHLVDLVRDGRRFHESHKWVIENYPLQAYTSAVVFSPTRSLIREHFKQEKPQWVQLLPTIAHQWSSCLQTLEGHRDWVRSVVFWHDGKHLASASGDKTVKIWDATDGTCLQTLDVDITVRDISFDKSASFLLTEIGAFELKRQSDPMLEQSTASLQQHGLVSVLIRSGL